MNTLVIGASSAIAQAIIQRHRDQHSFIMTVSSKPLNFNDPSILSFQCDYSEISMSKIISDITQLHLLNLDRVYICNGVLHNESIKVEKRIEDIKPDALMSLMHSNAFVPILWLQALFPILRKQSTKITVFNARIGSISDNHLGGWYSYRASKAALNMLLKNVSIEYQKRAKGIKLLSFHPGTTDTPLSQPFQKNVPSNNLLTPEFVAEQLEIILDQLPSDGTLSYLDWQGKEIPW